jgi:hypothetical protein
MDLLVFQSEFPSALHTTTMTVDSVFFSCVLLLRAELRMKNPQLFKHGLLEIPEPARTRQE